MGRFAGIPTLSGTIELAPDKLIKGLAEIHPEIEAAGLGEVLEALDLVAVDPLVQVEYLG